MKRFITSRKRLVIPLSVVAALVVVGVVTVTASASTQHDAAAPTPTCSLAGVAGAWGNNFEGWNTNGVLTPLSGAGRSVIDDQGNVSGTETISQTFFGESTNPATMTGTLSVNADCTGILTETFYDQSNNVLRKEVWNVVLVDNETAMRAMLLSLGLGPNLFNVTQISATMSADKLFPPTGQ